MTRWFRVQADIFDHPAFAASEFSEREAFLWLIARAAWRETRHRVGNEMVDVPRGSLFVTLRELRDTWGWKSDFRVRAFLDMLEKETMIERNSNAGKTQITICNYCKYQDVQRTENASATQAQRTDNALNIPIYQYTKDITPLIPLPGGEQNHVSKPAKKERSESGSAFNPRKALEALGCDQKHIDGWLKVRQAKRSPLTEAALDALQREANKAN